MSIGAKTMRVIMLFQNRATPEVVLVITPMRVGVIASTHRALALLVLVVPCHPTHAAPAGQQPPRLDLPQRQHRHQVLVLLVTGVPQLVVENAVYLRQDGDVNVQVLAVQVMPVVVLSKMQIVLYLHQPQPLFVYP